MITSSTAEVEVRQAAAIAAEENLSVQSVQIAADKEEAEAELAAAIPALEEAAAALNNLKKEDITEIRSFAKPHEFVQKVRCRDGHRDGRRDGCRHGRRDGHRERGGRGSQCTR